MTRVSPRRARRPRRWSTTRPAWVPAFGLLSLVVLSLTAACPTWAAAPPASPPQASPAAADRADDRAPESGSFTALLADLARRAPTLDTAVLALALRAAEQASRLGVRLSSDILTVIDYSKPSTERRLWVFDLARRQLLFEELVAHGKNTGEQLAERFSNLPESRMSSLGLFRTAETYQGEHGYSLRLDGLEPGVNDNCRARAIVVHGAEYVSDAFAQREGRLGRSWGCPAVRPEVSRRLIDTIKDGSLVFAYYPSPAWIAKSRFLQFDGGTSIMASRSGPTETNDTGTPASASIARR